MIFNERKVGANYKDAQCIFSVWAPHRHHVGLHIKNQIIDLKPEAYGYWSVEVSDIKPGEQYYFVLDRDKKLPDPASLYQPDGVHGASAVIDQSFSWTDHDWKGIPMKEMIIYELHVGTFTEKHNFEGIIDRLPYLKNLGINTIELMPIAEFPGARNWGYDGVFPFAVHHAYGAHVGLKRVVDAAHQLGIAVILDVVYNHVGPEGNYLNEYGPYFTTKYQSFWGNAMNFDDAYSYGVRNFYWQNALMWLEDFHIDGLRMDAVHAIWDFGAKHFIQELMQKVRALEKALNKTKVIIAELDLNNPRYIDPEQRGGYAMDGQWIDEFHHALHALLTGEVNGYYEDFGKAFHLSKALRDSYVYTGEYSVHRKKYFGARPVDHPYSQFVVFSQNHDQIGNRMLGDRLTTQLSLEALKLAAATVLLSPHVPLLFMGEEYGEKKPFQYFISHLDEELVEQVRKGRKEEFSYFKWSGEVPDPQSEDTFEQCVLSWKTEEGEGRRLFHFYRELIALRKNHPAFHADERNSVEVLDMGEKKIIAFTRKGNNDVVLILLNFNASDVDYTITSDNVFKIFDSAAVEWNGPGECNLLGKSILLKAHSAVVLELQ
jgi:maltooligosyltrehalose trehalohydrolase